MRRSPAPSPSGPPPRRSPRRALSCRRPARPRSSRSARCSARRCRAGWPWSPRRSRARSPRTFRAAGPRDAGANAYRPDAGSAAPRQPVPQTARPFSDAEQRRQAALNARQSLGQPPPGDAGRVRHDRPQTFDNVPRDNVGFPARGQTTRRKRLGPAGHRTSPVTPATPGRTPCVVFAAGRPASAPDDPRVTHTRMTGRRPSTSQGCPGPTGTPSPTANPGIPGTRAGREPHSRGQPPRRRRTSGKPGPRPIRN